MSIRKITGNWLQATNTKVFLTGGARAENIFWQVACFVEVGVGADMQGILLCFTSVAFKTESSLVTGRILSQRACTLAIKATITAP